MLDLWVYGWHRANHRIAFLWRFHQVHHRDKALDVTTALRFHPGEVLISALARAPVILVLAVPLSSVVVFEALVLAAAAFHHSNWNIGPGAERILSRVIVTPGIHWVHHHDRQADTDSNYATILSIWDRLFASRSPTERSLEMTLGVEHADELPFARLAALPLRSSGLTVSRRAEPAPRTSAGGRDYGVSAVRGCTGCRPPPMEHLQREQRRHRCAGDGRKVHPPATIRRIVRFSRSAQCREKRAVHLTS